MPHNNDQAIYDYYMHQLAEKGFIALEEVQEDANFESKRFPNQKALAMFLFDHLLEEVNSRCQMLSSLSNKDKLFEIIMVFCDCLTLYRKTIIRILNDQIQGAILILQIQTKIYHKLYRFLKNHQLLQPKLEMVYTYCFAGLLLCTLRQWIKDLSDDQGETMAYLSNLLDKGETLKSNLGRFYKDYGSFC